jgi:hypothetical protein
MGKWFFSVICLSVAAFCAPLDLSVGQLKYHYLSDVLGSEKGDAVLLIEGKTYPLDEGLSFVFGFDRKPQLGTLIVRVQVFSKEGRQDTSLTITGNADMPSMRGAHSTGVRPFQLNRKGDYLLPVSVVMPGVWEVNITFNRQGKPIFKGNIRFSA